jgi:hypothetical protein
MWKIGQGELPSPAIECHYLANVVPKTSTRLLPSRRPHDSLISFSKNKTGAAEFKGDE